MTADRPMFAPIEIGGVTVKNRVMQVATRTNLHDKDGVTDELVAYYRERLQGGVGSIVVEPLASPRAVEGQPSSFARSNLGKQDAQAIKGLRRLADVAHEHEAHAFGQLFHGGRQHHSTFLPLLIGPSALACPQSGGVPHAMDQEEIAATITGYVDAAASYAEAGFDGVEIHGAQGHLIQEFLSPFSNRREDDFGGPFENRTRFLRSILEGVRKACGPDFILGLRLATTEASPDGIEVEEAARIAQHAVEHGVAYLSLSAGNFNSIELHIPDRTFPEVPLADHAATIKGAIPDIPVIVCGRVLTPENGDRLIRTGKADLIGLCRPLICDPEWTSKAAADADDSIRTCISCNQCWAEITSGRPVRCVHNPAAGRELKWGNGTLGQVSEPRRVVVVGGGPAGMEAARTAASRGNHVILFERSRHLGGSVAEAATIPGHGEVGYVVDYLSESLKPAGVEVRTGPAAEVDAARILDEMPDAVVIATGASHARDSLGVPSDLPVYTSLDVVAGDLPLGDRCVLFDQDGYYEPCETAELIARGGTKLSIVTRFLEVGREIPKTAKISILRELDRLDVELIPTHWAERVEGRTVHLAHYYSGRTRSIEEVDSLVHVGAKAANDSLYHALKDKVVNVYRIGDAYMPRRIMDAVREGHDIGRHV